MPAAASWRADMRGTASEESSPISAVKALLAAARDRCWLVMLVPSAPPSKASGRRRQRRCLQHAAETALSPPAVFI
eukprot:scaffold8263_cov104-Isochrysis_galbana.AAC.5